MADATAAELPADATAAELPVPIATTLLSLPPECHACILLAASLREVEAVCEARAKQRGCWRRNE